MQVSAKLYTARVYWSALKSHQIENFFNRDQLLRFVNFFEKHPPHAGKPLFEMEVYESDVYYFTAAESWHVMSPKELDMNLLRAQAREFEKPAIVPNDTLELKPGEDITK